MDLDVESVGAVSVLKLPENLTSHYAESLKTCLRHSMDNRGRLVVDCKQVTAVDPDCLKVLCSAYRLSRRMRKDFIVAGHQSGLFLKAVKDTQYEHCVGCGVESLEGCLWGMR